MYSAATPKPSFVFGPDLDTLDDDAFRQSGFRNALAWDSPHVRSLFKQKQYWLDDLKKSDHTDWWIDAYPPNLPSESETLDSKQAPNTSLADIDPYPFAYNCPSTNRDGERILFGIVMGGKDAQGRPIIAKIFNPSNDDSEAAIYRHLHNEDPAVLKNNCILPILDIIDFDDKVSFIVMPKWYCLDGRLRFDPKTVGDMFTMIHSLLKGMAYLHRNKIVHRDIRDQNLVCNYGVSLSANESISRQLREARRLRLAYIDFDRSMMFPPETDIASVQLPRHCAGITYEHDPIPELEKGQLTYNPFALEVARLGYLFLRFFRNGIEDIPTLAPLVSMMTNWDVSRRFTADQALSFCEEHCMPRANETWDNGLRSPPVVERVSWDTPAEWWNPWHLTEPSFAKEWVTYQPRPSAFTVLKAEM